MASVAKYPYIFVLFPQTYYVRWIQRGWKVCFALVLGAANLAAPNLNPEFASVSDWSKLLSFLVSNIYASGVKVEDFGGIS
jgi:hypothetical protein